MPQAVEEKIAPLADNPNYRPSAFMEGRFVRVAVTLPILTAICTPSTPGYYWSCTRGLPADACRIKTYFEDLKVVTVYAHSSFDPVDEGAEIPWFTPTLTQCFVANDVPFETLVAGEVSELPGAD